MKATVVRINDRGFGFLNVEGEEDDIFFHSNDIEGDIDIRQLRVDDEVTVDLEPSRKKSGRYEAKNVVPDDERVRDRPRQERRRDDRRGGGRDYGGRRRDDRYGGGRRDRDRDYGRRDRRDRRDRY